MFTVENLKIHTQKGQVERGKEESSTSSTPQRSKLLVASCFLTLCSLHMYTCTFGIIIMDLVVYLLSSLRLRLGMSHAV